MKTIHSAIVFVFALGVMTSCQKTRDFKIELSPEDELAIEGMEESYELAYVYNDSLSWCNDTSINCTPSFLQFCDSIYHQNVEEYTRHHDNYSHSNSEDDHHHGSGNRNHGGTTGGHMNNDNHGHHNQENNDEMNALYEQHSSYHPN